MKKINLNFQTDLTENKELRNKLIQRTEVLNKVKELFLIPKLNVMTVKQVADYYEVDTDVIQKLYQRNKIEIDTDGTALKTLKDFLIGQDVQLKTLKGKSIIKISDNITLEIPNRGLKCFSQRAILRIGMLLRDSKIAKEIRTQLLNVFENSNENQKVNSIDEETEIMNSMGKALLNGDFEELKQACLRGFNFKNRHIEKLNKTKCALQIKNQNLIKTNKALAKDINTWDDRAVLNALLRAIGHHRFNGNMQYAWNTYYKNLLYKEGINLRSRTSNKKGKLLDCLKPDEWKAAISVAVAMCEESEININKILNKVNVDKISDSDSEFDW